MKQFLKFTFASCLGFLLSFFTICIIVAIVIVATVTGFSSKQITVAPNSVLKIEFNGVLKEQARDMSFFDAWSSTNVTELGIHDIIKSIPKQTKILLEFGCKWIYLVLEMPL